MGSCNYTMAALARSYQKFLRVAPQAPALARQMSGGHGGGYETWKKGFFFAAIPTRSSQNLVKKNDSRNSSGYDSLSVVGGMKSRIMQDLLSKRRGLIMSLLMT